MLNIGRNNRLKVIKTVDHGVYLDSTDGREILLPAKYVPAGTQEGDEIDVFIYNDSEDRLIATTETPLARVGEFAYLNAVQVNSVGAFLDWGITAKDLLAPFREQATPMAEGRRYLVYVYLDDTTKRIVASSKIDKHVGNVLPRYRQGQGVRALVIQHTPIGYKCIVDNLHYGMLYDNETFKQLRIGDTVDAFVKKTRPDGKIDITLGDRADRRTGSLGETILQRLRQGGGMLPLSDKSAPEDIQRTLQCSKKDFKKAIGHLYKDHLITIHPDCIKLSE